MGQLHDALSKQLLAQIRKGSAHGERERIAFQTEAETQGDLILKLMLESGDEWDDADHKAYAWIVANEGIPVAAATAAPLIGALQATIRRVE